MTFCAKDQGLSVELRNLLESLKSEYECGGEVLGPGEGEVRELKFLGRKIRYTESGLEWEGDDKHALNFVEKLGLTQSKGVATPGVKHDESTVGAGQKELGKQEAKEYRGLVALLNFMGQDRCDLSFASKEVSKSMSSPAEGDQVPLKRLGRYLVSYPRSVALYKWQEPVANIAVFSDSDWGGVQ